jgi:hypothetical protein
LAVAGKGDKEPHHTLSEENMRPCESRLHDRNGRRVPLGNARPSVTKKQREQKRRERQAMKAEKRAQRKLAAQAAAANERDSS